MSLHQAIFPSQWKRANIFPVFKNNIDLFPYFISTCMERCVYTHAYNHLLQNDILTRLTSLALQKQLVNTCISNEFGKALDSGKEIRFVFL